MIFLILYAAIIFGRYAATAAVSKSRVRFINEASH